MGLGLVGSRVRYRVRVARVRDRSIYTHSHYVLVVVRARR